MNKKINGFPKFFPNSRVPVCFFFDYLKKGLSKNDFHSSYPWLKIKDIDFVINELKNKTNENYCFG